MTRERDTYDRAVTSARARLARGVRTGAQGEELAVLRSQCSEAVVARVIERHMYRLDEAARARLAALLKR